MERQEAIDLLKEISEAYGESIPIDSVSLSQDETPTEILSQSSKSTDPAQSQFKVYLRTDLDLNKENCLADILQKHGLRMARENNSVVIYRPTSSLVHKE